MLISKRLYAPALLAILSAVTGSGALRAAPLQQRSLIQPTAAHTVQPDHSHCGELKHGRVVTRIGLNVSTDGLPENLTVAQSTGDPCLDESALAAVKQYRFHPATLDGQPVKVSITIEISFERL